MDRFGRYEHFPDPVTLSIIAVSMVAAGEAYGGISAYQEGKSEAGMEKYNAGIATQESKQIEVATGIEQIKQSQEASRQMSGLEAQAGVKSGGSPLEVMAKQASESELENLTIGYEGQVKAGQKRSEAEMALMRGKLAKQRGRNAMIGSFMKAGGTMLGGFGQNKTPENTTTGNKWSKADYTMGADW